MEMKPRKLCQTTQKEVLGKKKNPYVEDTLEEFKIAS